ncbi:Gustatory receptor 2b [Ladona fulva]|uniref:Gustatory receptor n=1 Tax=Ladona fulva TaxID=123851 RepID=A0A8K0KHD0_LADFU|nr:Gustatory receptor 2b [Ladona fulva]
MGIFVTYMNWEKVETDQLFTNRDTSSEMKTKINPKKTNVTEQLVSPNFKGRRGTSEASGIFRKRKSSKKIRMGIYYNTMELILKALRLVGCLPLSIDEQNSIVEFRLLSTPMVFAVLIFSLWSLLAFLVIEDRLRIMRETTDSFDESISAYIFIVCFWQWPLTPFVRWFWQTPRLLSFLARWKNFEGHYERITKTSMKREMQTTRLAVVVLVYSIPWVCTALIIISNFIIPKIRIMHLVAYWYLAVEMYINTSLAWATSQALTSASKGLVRGLRKDVHNSGSLTGGTRNWAQEYMADGDIRDELTLMLVRPRTSKKIRDFLQMMDATPPYISIGEYITVNKEFVSQLLGTMVTYVVVLMQFRHAKDSPHSSEIHRNGNISQEYIPTNFTDSY